MSLRNTKLDLEPLQPGPSSSLSKIARPAYFDTRSSVISPIESQCMVNPCARRHVVLSGGHQVDAGRQDALKEDFQNIIPETAFPSHVGMWGGGGGGGGPPLVAPSGIAVVPLA